MSVPTSSETGRVRAGWIPHAAVYSASLPVGMAMPPAPWSPSPRIRSLSVTTMSRTSSNGPWRRRVGIRSRSAGVIHVPRVRRMMWLNSWHARPTVGV